MDFFVPKPAWTPDEQFHRAVTEALDGWWRQLGNRFEAVTVIGADLSARAHEIRDVLTRTSVPFGFHRRDSAEGQAAVILTAIVMPPALCLFVSPSTG